MHLLLYSTFKTIKHDKHTKTVLMPNILLYLNILRLDLQLTQQHTYVIKPVRCTYFV